MAKQKTVTAAKSGKRKGRQAPKRSASTIPSVSTTPAPGPVRAQMITKLKVPAGRNALTSMTPPLENPLLEHEESLDLPVAQPTSTLRRSGRPPKKSQKADYHYGSDIHLDPSQVMEVDDGEDYQPRIQSSPRKSYHATTSPARSVLKLSSAPIRQAVQNGQHLQAKKGAAPSSKTLGPTSPPLVLANNVFDLDLDPFIYKIVGELQRSSKTLIDLPFLAHPNNNTRERPYTAKYLLHSYLLCYEYKSWDLCDLIADTWIRQFHILRDKGKQDAHFALWRPNAALEKRQRHARDLKLQKVAGAPTGFDETAPEYGLVVVDPVISGDVLDFSSLNLNELYQYTLPQCGARRLWADAMALGGDKVEEMLVRTARRGIVWHPDLLFNIMTSSLRLVRRKLTLKIEETTEGAYCKRYHEHTKHRQPCYRELAWKHKLAGGDSSDEDDDDDVMARMIEAEFAKDGDTGREDRDGATGGDKRVRICDDLDAESESEDE